MKLDRNKNSDGKGKYVLIKLRDIENTPTTPEELALEIIKNPECVDFGYRHSDSEFFVLRLKDINAYAALNAYAESAMEYDEEWANQVLALAVRASRHQNKKIPD